MNWAESHGQWCETVPAVFWLRDLLGDDDRQQPSARVNFAEIVDQRLHGQDAGAVLLQFVNDLARQRLGDTGFGCDGFPALRSGSAQMALEVVND